MLMCSLQPHWLFEQEGQTPCFFNSDNVVLASPLVDSCTVARLSRDSTRKDS